MTHPFRYSIFAIRLVWGEKSSDGSWHSIDGRKYVAEFQIALKEENNNNFVGLFFLFEVVKNMKHNRNNNNKIRSKKIYIISKWMTTSISSKAQKL